MSWTKCVDSIPPEGKDYLVWTGKSMIVSEPTIYTPDQIEEFLKLAENTYFVQTEEQKNSWIKHYKECKGYFQEFGQKYYFDDPKIQWAELPQPPEQE